jgi:urease accessory protein
VSEKAADGLLALRFVSGAGGRTELANRSQRFPLRWTVPMYLDPGDPGMAFVYVQNPTGGLFAGDRLVTRLAAEAQTRVHLTTQSATKAYRMVEGDARHRIEITLGQRAFVEYAPDLLIPQAGASVEQELAVEVADDAAFLGIETVAPGRLARGEAFAYKRLRLATEVRAAGGPALCADTLLLEPARRSPRRRGLLGSYPYLGLLLAVAPASDAEALAGRLDAALAAAPDSLAAAGALPAGAGAFARVLAPTPGAARRALDAAWNAARQALVGLPLPPRRK